MDGVRASLGLSGLANGGSALPLADLLDSAGKNIGDVEMVSLNPGGDTLAALANGSVGITQLLPPFSNDPQVTDCCVKMRDLLATGRYVAMASAIEEQPEVFEAFARAILRTQRTYLQGNYYEDDDVVAFLAEWTGAPLETVKQGSASYDFGDDLQNDAEAVEQAQDLWLEAQTEGWTSTILDYDEPIDVAKVVDPSIVDAVNAE
jgi:NitT/TauT family transport system substrate-binding protein